MKIGNVQLDHRAFLAPMAGVTDLPFRLICKRKGCGLVYTEMVSSRALYHRDPKTQSLLKIEPEEKPVAIQIFGSEPEMMARAAYELNERENLLLDINMGCPAPKIVKNGDGSALMRNPKLAGEIIRAVVKESVKPVTVKIRKGWDDHHVNAVEMAKIAEENGAAAVTLHGRTREQYYSGKADWDIIKQVKEAISIPLIGNGDVFTVEDGIRMLKETNCDGIMIGRGAQGNPWIFQRLQYYMEHGELLPEPTLEEKMATIYQHMELILETKGAYIGIREMRKHIPWYLKGLKYTAQLRNRINQVETQEAMIEILESFYQEQRQAR